ncbi:MAG TPA: hypothetical protein VN700_15265 [Vicinamibacterales bacterium]|nr:hypothetical protein [Vicinamibacterales bacterium]
MKPLSAVIVGLLFIGATAVRAESQCGLFSTDSKCRPASRPSVKVDFSKGMKTDVPAQQQSPWVSIKPAPVTESRPAIDCHMVHRVDRNPDPHMIVKAPPPGVTHALRVIKVPPCPIK